MFNFNYELISAKESLQYILLGSGNGVLIERVKYITSTKPVEMFKQIGVSRGDAFRIMYCHDKLPTISNKELVNYIDYDSWDEITSKPQLKEKYNINFANKAEFSMYYQLYFAKYHNWVKGETKIVHSKNSNMTSELYNRDIVLLIVNNEMNIDSLPSPSTIIGSITNLIDVYIEQYYKEKLLADYDATTNVPNWLSNHCFTNIHVIKSVSGMVYTGRKLRHCAYTPCKIRNFQDGDLFVQIKTNDPRVPEYTVHYKWNYHATVYVEDYARNCNMPFPKDFDFSDMIDFKLMLKQRLLDASWGRL